MKERRFMTFEMIVYLSNRDTIRVIEEADSSTILKACRDINSAPAQKIANQFTDKGVQGFMCDLKKLSPISDDDCKQAQDQLSHIVDRLLTEGEFEDLQIKHAA